MQNKPTPPGWLELPLGETATLQRGFDLPIQERRDGPFPVYGSNGIDGWHDRLAAAGPGVITGRSGSIGFVFLEQKNFWPLNTTLYVKDFHGNHPAFIARLLEWIRLARFAASTGVPSLNRNFVHPIRVLLPPLPEQRRIAEILDTVDQAIQQTEALIAKLKQMKAGLLHDLLTRGLDAHGQLRDPVAQPEAFKDSAAGRVPKEWRVDIIGNLVESAIDGPFGSNLKTEHYVAEPGIRVVRLQNIETGRFNDFDKVFIASEHAQTLQKHQVVSGDLLVAALGDDNHPIARTCLYPEGLKPGIVKADCFRLRLKSSVAINSYLMLVLNCPSTRKEVNILGQGVTRDRINLTTLQKVRVAVPSIPEQSRISEILQAQDSRISSEKDQLDKLKQVKQGLMEDLLTGRVRVRHIGAISA